MMSEPIRVLQVLGRLDLGGAETMIMNLYRQIDRRHVQFDFVIHTQEECAYSKEVRMLGGKIYSMPRFRGSNMGAYQRAWNLFFKEHPEYRIIHGHMRSTAAIYLRIANKYGLVTIAHSHNMSSGSGYIAALKNILQFPIRFVADERFACSVESGIWLYGKRKVSGAHFHVLNNAIDTSKYVYRQEIRARVRSQMEIGDNCLVIGHVGRFEEQKNHRFLLEIAAQVIERRKQEGLETRLWLVGEGVLEKEIHDKAAELGIGDHVVFLGRRTDVEQLMQGMDVMVFPSLFEGLPVTLIEAQTAGLPIIASDTITKETAVTDLIRFMSLKETAESWAECICKTAGEHTQEIRNCQVLQVQESVTEAGYDIVGNAKWLEAYYCRLL